MEILWCNQLRLDDVNSENEMIIGCSSMKIRC